MVLTQWSIDRNFSKLDKSGNSNNLVGEAKLNEYKYKQLVYDDMLRIADQERLQAFEKPR